LKVIIMVTAGLNVVCGKKALNRRVSAICGKGDYRLRCSTGQRAAAAASKQRRWLSVSDIAPPLKNGSVKPSEAPKGMAEYCVELQHCVEL
jgi:hypothetical protein